MCAAKAQIVMVMKLKMDYLRLRVMTVQYWNAISVVLKCSLKLEGLESILDASMITVGQQEHFKEMENQNL